jgi:hypothetical protein
MKLLTYAVVGIGLLGANANPLRVLLIDPPHNIPNTVSNVATINAPPRPWEVIQPPTANRQTCRARFREKAIAISNAFRQALGLAPIPVDPATVGKGVGRGDNIRILPFIGNPNGPTFIKVGEGKDEAGGMTPNPHHHRFKCGGIKGFMTRLHRSLNALGPWEAKVVAFVLGCGIGVLLRMFWVLAIISYRAIKGSREPENTHTEYSLVLDQSDMEPAEVIFVAPPAYADQGEKAALREDAN